MTFPRPGPSGAIGAAVGRRNRRGPRLLTIGTVAVGGIFSFSCTGCSPLYLAKAGLAQWQILAARRPIAEVVADPRTDPETRRKLLLAQQARAFARHVLGMEVGDQYTSYASLNRDTLAWVLSAAPTDRLEPKTWWFPIVGRVPYLGYPSREAAEKARSDLEARGFDTYLRPTTAFSTLGWFSDPVLSTFLDEDEVGLVETILHELAHVHLWVPGQVRFNESFATFVGQVGSIRFFCGPRDFPQPPPSCVEARRRWGETVAFSAFLDSFLSDLAAVYARTDLSREDKVRERESLRKRWQEKIAEDLNAPALVSVFLRRPLNNASLLARVQYYHRLRDFQRYLEDRGGDLAQALHEIKTLASRGGDPFSAVFVPAQHSSERGSEGARRISRTTVSPPAPPPLVTSPIGDRKGKRPGLENASPTYEQP